MMVSWITENMCEFWTDQIAGLLETFGTSINNVFFTMVDAGTSNEYVINANKFLVMFSLLCVALLVGKTVLDTDVLETAHDSDEDPVNLVVRIAQTVAVISCSGAIFDYLLKFSKDFAGDLLSSSNATGVADITRGLINVDTSNFGTASSMYIIAILITLIGYIVFTVLSALRGAELIAMNLFTSLFALDLLTLSRERWSNFLIGYLLAFVSYGFQTLFFMLSLKSYASSSINDMDYYISTIGWMLMAITGPHFLEKYLYKSGVSKAAGSGLRMVARTALMKGL